MLPQSNYHSDTRSNTLLTEFRLVNVVSSTRLNQDIDIEGLLASKLKAEYEPAVFPGLIYRRLDPKATVIMFGSGKITSIGSRSVKDSKQAISKTVQELRDSFASTPTFSPITVENIMAVATYRGSVNLGRIAKNVRNIEYDQAKFSAAIYRTNRRHITALIFRSGKIVCVGARNEHEAKDALLAIAAEIKRDG